MHVSRQPCTKPHLHRHVDIFWQRLQFTCNFYRNESWSQGSFNVDIFVDKIHYLLPVRESMFHVTHIGIPSFTELLYAVNFFSAPLCFFNNILIFTAYLHMHCKFWPDGKIKWWEKQEPEKFLLTCFFSRSLHYEWLLEILSPYIHSQ
jgi:hypothetical protein